MKLINNLQMRGDLQLHFYFIEEQTHSVENWENSKINRRLYLEEMYIIINVYYNKRKPEYENSNIQDN